jgi:lipoyl-dependent peroxiredoxin
MAQTLYTAHARTTGGRDGRATTVDGRHDLLIKVPKELGGPDEPEATNPEELFALGYGACFLSALSLVARSQKISAKAFHIDSAVSLVQDEGGFSVAVELHGELPGVDDDRAAELMRTAHTVCPYSRATRGNVPVKLFVGDREVDGAHASA